MNTVANDGGNTENEQPPVWSRATRVAVVLIGLLILALFLYTIRQLLGPLTIAGLIAYTIHPLVNRLQVYDRFSHRTAVRLVYLPFVILLIIIPILLTPQLIPQIQTLSDEFQILLIDVQTFIAQPIIIWGHTITQADWTAYFNLDTSSWELATDNALHVLETTSTSVIWFITILIVTYYLLLDWSRLSSWLIGLAPAQEQPDLRRLIREIDSILYSYVRGTLALMFMMGIFFIVVGLAIGLPGAIALGLLTGLLSMIPELGPTIAAMVAGTVALFQGSNFLPISNFWFAVLIIGIYFVVMQLKSFWIRPLVMGRFMHMNTGVVFVAVIGAVLIFGILAALIVLPLLATVGQIGYFIRCRLLGIKPWDNPTTPPIVS